MIARPYWITSELAILRRPREDRLDDEMLALREAGLNVVVSMLEEFEAKALGLEHEEVAATRAGLCFVSFPIPDGTAPCDLQQFDEFLTRLETHLANGQRIGVHCYGCIGRSSVVAVSLLIRSGIPASKAWNQIESARGSPVPDTLEQLEWVDLHMRPKPQ
jgi:protein-tyrosine phosphatase